MEEEERDPDQSDGMGVEAEEAEEPVAVAHYAPEPEGLGLDGSTPMEGGIQGRLTHSGGRVETPRNEYDWQVHVDVNQPVQEVPD
jgi:hypothetical protein